MATSHISLKGCLTNHNTGGLQEAGVTLTVDNMALLCRKYDSKNDGNVSYSEFLKKFSFIGRRSRCSSRASRDSDSKLVSKNCYIY